MSDYNDLILEWLTDPFNPNSVTVIPPMRYKRRTRDLNRQTMPGRVRAIYKGMI